MWVRGPACGQGFSASPHPLSPETGGEGGNVAFRRLVARPSRLPSAVAAATALQTATRRRGTKIRRPVPRNGGDARTGPRNRFFSIRFLCFCILFVSKRDVLHLVGFDSRWGVGCYMKETPWRDAIRQWRSTSFAPLPRLFGGRGDLRAAEPSTHRCAFHPQSSCSPPQLDPAR